MIGLTILLLVGLSASSADFVDKVTALTNPEVRITPFKENHVGYDLHADFFYFNDELVDAAYKRKKYTETMMTLAGQNPDITGPEVPQATHPFVVAQKSTNSFGTISDRWDVRSNEHGHQFLGLYHGTKGDFVVNKLRAHLLRNVANAIQDYLPILDNTADPSTSDKTDYTDKVHEELKSMIKLTFRDVDQIIRESMKANDDASAAASVVVITNNFVIVASVGGGRVLGYDSSGVVSELAGSSEQEDPSNPSYLNVFGLRKSKAGACEPMVEIYPRTSKDEDGDDMDLQFVVMESKPLAERLAKDEVVKTILSQINQHKMKDDQEQEIYTSSATRIMKMATGRLNMFQKMQKPDYSLIFVGLQTDYSQIH